MNFSLYGSSLFKAIIYGILVEIRTLPFNVPKTEIIIPTVISLAPIPFPKSTEATSAAGVEVFSSIFAGKTYKYARLMIK